MVIAWWCIPFHPGKNNSQPKRLKEGQNCIYESIDRAVKRLHHRTGDLTHDARDTPPMCRGRRVKLLFMVNEGVYTYAVSSWMKEKHCPLHPPKTWKLLAYGSGFLQKHWRQMALQWQRELSPWKRQGDEILFIPKDRPLKEAPKAWRAPAIHHQKVHWESQRRVRCRYLRGPGGLGSTSRCSFRVALASR